MMKTRIVMTAALAAALAGAGARAQEGSSFDAAAEAAAAMTEAKAKQKVYHILPYCKTLEGGAAEVRRPGSEEWEPIVEGKFYALGTEFRTVGAVGKFVISLGKDVSVVVTGEGSFSLLPPPLGPRSRTVVLRGGEIVGGAVNIAFDVDGFAFHAHAVEEDHRQAQEGVLQAVWHLIPPGEGADQGGGVVQQGGQQRVGGVHGVRQAQA